MLLNDQKIKEMFTEYTGDERKEYYYFYGIITAGFGKTMLLGALASFANKYYIVGVNEKEIALIGIGMNGKPNGHTIVERSKVQSTKISNWLFGMGKKIHFTLEDGTMLKFKVSKHCMGIKKQKENLLSIKELVNRGLYNSY